MSQTTMPMGGEEPHEFKPGACAWPGCGKWHTNAIHDVAPLRAVDAPTDPVGGNHPETARRTGAKMAPKLGSKRRHVYGLADRGYSWDKPGVTGDEVSAYFNWGHQSASAAVSTLKRDGWLKVLRDEFGKPVTRPTRSGNPAEVMVVARAIATEEAA